MSLAAFKLHLLFKELIFVLQTAFFLILDLLIIALIEPLLVPLFIGHWIICHFTWDSSNRSDITIDALHAEEARLILLNIAHSRLLLQAYPRLIRNIHI